MGSQPIAARYVVRNPGGHYTASVRDPCLWGPGSAFRQAIATVNRPLPANLGPYRLLALVHEGRGCRLWKAADDLRHRTVALKTPREDLEPKRLRSQKRYLRREWEVTGPLTSERITKAYEFVQKPGVCYLAMEWCPWPNMKTCIRQGGQALSGQIPTIVVEATEAVVLLHGRGWIHRDIKPENFLVGQQGQVKLIDFALALRKPGFFARLLRLSGRRKGTRAYMSPEQIRGGPLDERSDLYSLACTLYELISGSPPFVASDSNELLTKHLRSAPPALEAIQPAVTPEFAQLIRWAMAKDPAARPQSSWEFCQRLRRVSVFRTGGAA